MKKLSKILSILLIIMFIFIGCSPANPIESTTKPTTEITTEITTEQTTTPVETIISEEVEEIAQDTIESIENGENIDTDENIRFIEERKLEEDGTVELENIAWDGATPADKTKAKSLLGKYQGITYYSQADSRWAKVLYTSTKNKTQTIKSSGCGPTSAAMIISSSKGAILPTATAKLSADNGYRTTNNGTAWSYWAFIADLFDFKFFTDTNDFSKVISYISKDANKDGKADYFAVASCGPGLFTTSGHYIAIMGDTNKTVRVHDPYYYAGKYNTTSRKAANVKMVGNVAYLTETNFKKHANAKHFWIFSNDHKEYKTRYVSIKGTLKVRQTPSSKAKIVKELVNGKKVKVYQTKGEWDRIGKDQWVKTKYLVKKSQLINYKTTVGKTYVIKERTHLYSKGNLTGTEYTYKAGAKAKVLKHYNTKVDKVYIAKTGRTAYIKVDKLSKK